MSRTESAYVLYVQAFFLRLIVIEQLTQNIEYRTENTSHETREYTLMNKCLAF
jgi:hypothetical protein